MSDPEEITDYGEAVTDHGPHAGQVVHKYVICMPMEEDDERPDDQRADD